MVGRFHPKGKQRASGGLRPFSPWRAWREVVERVRQETPDTLLLAEAFWMMEGYFVRTLGMHRAQPVSRNATR